MEYAVVKTGGKQYRVSVGDVLEVEHLQNDGKSAEFSEVLLVVSDGAVTVGTPTVQGAVVKASVLGDVRGEKIKVTKFKSKVRHRRTTGHRQSLSKVKIEEIVASKKK